MFLRDDHMRLRTTKVPFFLCLFCREGKGDNHLILHNHDVRQIRRLDAKVRQIDGTGRRSRDRFAYNLAL